MTNRSSQAETLNHSHLRDTLHKKLQVNAEECIECKLCVKECNFLQKYGTPKSIAENYTPHAQTDQVMPFECSLCKVCTAVCPVKLNPGDMFLEMRRESVGRDVGDFSEHGTILGYEKRGTSKRYSYYALPANCETVLFPGCTLSGTRPDKVFGLFDHPSERQRRAQRRAIVTTSLR